MINTCTLFLLIAAFSSVLLFVKCGDNDDIKYSVPVPKIEVFARGFRVSIPDREGINLFAFHGNINLPMDDLEAGQFSRDILTKEDGHWVFEETRRKVNVGDVIYYWLFVIRFNLGYRFDNGRFVVKEIMPYNPLQSDGSKSSQVNTSENNQWYFEPLDKLTPILRPNQNATCSNSSLAPINRNQLSLETSTEHKPVSTCCQLYLNLTNQIALLSDQIDRLAEENIILSQIAQKDDHYAKTLRVFGKYPNEYYPTPQDFAENLISEKLKLEGIKVLEAKKIPDNGISFKVESLKDKIKIILAAQELLEGSNYEISW